ncbi:hypothetical protein R3P38DRAFT_2509117 [Favolaschia claudopus]|uniref:HNH nuclease domain-containing protein n=1 Tax=Favolaschia claudopus TaxID=2862362 RepID=A0AAW0D2S1_9AGAR
MATTPDDATDYGHFLSTHSKAMGFDTFFWVTRHPIAELLIGVNQNTTPMTCALFSTSDDDVDEEECQKIYICPVEITSTGVLQYWMTPNGNVFEPNSEAPLPTGNYGIFFDAECMRSGLPALQYSREHYVSIAWYFWDESKANIDQSLLNSIPAQLRNAATLRDSSRCVFTDEVEELTSVWIIPPSVAWTSHQTSDSSVEEHWNQEPFVHVANILTIQASLVVYFYQHYFAVDVDDGYKIIILKTNCDIRDMLPTHFTPGENYDPATDTFLRMHFRYSIIHQNRKGDIHDEYTVDTVAQIMFDLGVPWDVPVGEAMETIAPPHDPRWETDLGREIRKDFEKRLAIELARSLQLMEEPKKGDGDLENNSD